MLVSYKWLQDFLPVKTDPKDLAEKITRTGIEIASVRHPMEGLKKLVVGHILECEPHPNSDHLSITQVDVGENEPLQIVCGAPNVAADQYVIVALHGARIAGNEKIKRGKIRGVKSDGMICGLQEIGFPDSVVPEEFANGIYVFPNKETPGAEVYDLLGMDDYILDFDITPNRADTLSMEGAAYEVGAIEDEKPKIEPVFLKADGSDWTNELQVSADEKLAPKFFMRKLTNVKIAPSPLWLQIRLWNAGIRPVNNVVDATNYVMLLTGQPLHAYDATVFNTKKAEVRLAHKDEKMTLLNDKEINLDSEDIVITNGSKIVSLAGVMGSKFAQVTDKTTDVILESAIFDSALVRKAALRHDARSEASSRFEKGVNWDNTQKAIDMAALLLRNEAKAVVCDGEIKATDKIRKPAVIETTISHINKVLGTKLTGDEVEEIFGRLEFTTLLAGDKITVTVPNRRWDIEIPADLIEEVVRIYGYDNLQATKPYSIETQGGYSADEIKLRHLRSLVEGQGLGETINYSLTSPEKSNLFTKNDKDLVEVKWPMNSSRSVLRKNLISGLLDTASYNIARKQTELQIFEQGRVFNKTADDHDEYEHLAGLYSGLVAQSNWQHIDQKVDFYYVKGQVEDLFKAIGVTGVTYEADKIAGMHPTRTAKILINNQEVGFVGQVMLPSNLFDKNLNGHEIYVYELDLTHILPMMEKGVKSKPAPKYPSIERDLSILVDGAISNNEIEAVIKQNAGKYLVKLDVIDVYQGNQILINMKSITYKLIFRNNNDTLTDEVASAAIDKVQSALKEKLGAEVR